MPYDIEIRRRGKTKRKVYLVRNTRTGALKGTHETRKGADRQLSLLRGIEGGKWKPTGKPARKRRTATKKKK